MKTKFTLWAEGKEVKTSTNPKEVYDLFYKYKEEGKDRVIIEII